MRDWGEGKGAALPLSGALLQSHPREPKKKRKEHYLAIAKNEEEGRGQTSLTRQVLQNLQLTKILHKQTSDQSKKSEAIPQHKAEKIKRKKERRLFPNR